MSSQTVSCNLGFVCSLDLDAWSLTATHITILIVELSVSEWVSEWVSENDKKEVGLIDYSKPLNQWKS